MGKKSMEPLSLSFILGLLASHLCRPIVIHQWLEAGMEGLPACIDGTRKSSALCWTFQQYDPGEEETNLPRVYLSTDVSTSARASTSAKVPVAIRAE